MVVSNFCIWNWCRMAFNKRIQMLVRISPAVSFETCCPDVCWPFRAACTERRWQCPSWYPSAPRSKSQSGATYKSRLLPEKVPTLPSKDVANVPKVPVGPAHTLLVWVSYSEMRYMQWKSFNVMDVNNVVMQIINVSNKQFVSMPCGPTL